MCKNITFKKDFFYLLLLLLHNYATIYNTLSLKLYYSWRSGSDNASRGQRIRQTFAQSVRLGRVGLHIRTATCRRCPARDHGCSINVYKINWSSRAFYDWLIIGVTPKTFCYIYCPRWVREKPSSHVEINCCEFTELNVIRIAIQSARYIRVNSTAGFMQGIPFHFVRVLSSYSIFITNVF